MFIHIFRVGWFNILNQTAYKRNGKANFFTRDETIFLNVSKTVILHFFLFPSSLFKHIEAIYSYLLFLKDIYKFKNTH